MNQCILFFVGLGKCRTKPWPNCTMSSYFKHKWDRYNELLDLIPPSIFAGPRDALYQEKMRRKDDPKSEQKAEPTTKVETEKEEDKTKATRPKERHRLEKKHKNNSYKEKCCKKYAMIPVTIENTC